jgi:isoleucyl-tRNA synthetase
LCIAISRTTQTFKGTELLGKSYEPLFPYFASRPKAFVVLGDSYVTEDSGTGIVHQAPGHGEDDFRVCHHNGIISNEDIPCPLDASYVFRYT